MSEPRSFEQRSGPMLYPESSYSRPYLLRHLRALYDLLIRPIRCLSSSGSLDGDLPALYAEFVLLIAQLKMLRSRFRVSRSTWKSPNKNWLSFFGFQVRRMEPLNDEVIENLKIPFPISALYQGTSLRVLPPSPEHHSASKHFPVEFIPTPSSPISRNRSFPLISCTATGPRTK